MTKVIMLDFVKKVTPALSVHDNFIINMLVSYKSSILRTFFDKFV